MASQPQYPLSGARAEDLAAEVAALRARVLAIEQRLGLTPIAESAANAVAGLETTAIEVPAGIVPVLGRMLVAIAGAYVLRALTEWGTLPPSAGVAIGMAYGLLWLVLATRTQEQLTAAIYASTSVFIFGPVVWEASVRLKIMPSAVSAGALTAFALLGLAIGSRLIAGIAASFCLLLSFVLMLARNDIVPFTAGILILAIAMELSAWRNLKPVARPLAAITADVVILLFSFLMARPGGLPETWVPVMPASVLTAQVVLIAIYLSTAIYRTVLRHCTLTFAEMTQTGAALLTGTGGAVCVFHEQRTVMLALGAAAFLGGIACYAVSFSLFEHENKWNFRAWATFGFFLITIGMFLPFSRTGFWILSCICAFASCWIAKRASLPTLGVHGALFLAIASSAGGALVGTAALLFDHGSPSPIATVAVMVTGFGVWRAIAGLPTEGAGGWRGRLAYLIVASNSLWLAIGILTSCGAALWYEVSDTVGTIVLAGLSVALAWTAAQGRRRELNWILYGVMAIGGWKLLTRDFQTEHHFALVVSLACYGGALILIPRILRQRVFKQAR